MTGSGTGNGSFITIRLERISPARSIPSPALSLANSTPFPLLRKLLITSQLMITPEVLILPNYAMMAKWNLTDTRIGIMLPFSHLPWEL